MNFTVPPGSHQKWLEMVPYGLVGGMAPGMSLVIFKEKTGDNRFAIWLSRLQSQVAFQQGVRREETFSFLNPLLRSFQIKPTKCFFIRNENAEQFVKLHFSSKEKKVQLTLKANECIAFCMYHNCKFFCTKGFIESMREVKIGKNFFKNVKREPPAYIN